MVDYASSVKSLYHELILLFLVRVVIDFDHAALDQIHFLGFVVSLIDERSFFESFSFHTEEEFVFDVARQLLEI